MRPGEDIARPNPLGLTSEAFVEAYAGRVRVERWGGREGALHAYRRIFRNGDWTSLERAWGMPGPEIEAACVRRVGTTQESETAEGTLLKFTCPVEGVAGKFESLATESVLIPMIGRKRRRTYTLCVSSQVGCAMGCTFCETAQMGLIRHLTPAEIVSQWYVARHVLKHEVSNTVFMGMGEPLDNYDNVIGAVAVLKDHNGACLPISKITISTVGRVDGLAKLAAQIHEPGWHRLNLAISLNAPNDVVRDAIQPVNRKYPLAELQKALVDWPVYGGAKLCVEYVLIPGVNDAKEHAGEIAAFLEPINAKYRGVSVGKAPRTMINLIPYNPRRGSPWPAPHENDVTRFMAWLMEAGVYVTRRRTKGRDLMGACGQLGSEEIRGRKLVAVRVERSGA